jgi:hypothetical protein
MGPQRFLLGRLMATRGALNAFAATGENPITYIVRHMNLDPGSLGAADQLHNLGAVRECTRVLSAYELRGGTRIWIITEADRSAKRRSCCPRSTNPPSPSRGSAWG